MVASIANPNYAHKRSIWMLYYTWSSAMCHAQCDHKLLEKCSKLPYMEVSKVANCNILWSFLLEF